MGTRPAETGQLTVSAIIGALLFLYGIIKNGFDFEDLSNPEVQGAIMVVVGAVAAGITWYTARRQRDPADTLESAPDGTVQG